MEKINNAIKDIENYLSELETKYAEKVQPLDDETKQKAKSLLDKTKGIINSSIAKIESAVDDIKDDEKLDDLLAKVKAKSKEAVDFTLEKIDNLINNNKSSIDSVHDDIMAEFDKLKENDTFKKTTILIKEGTAKINEFLEKPEVKNTIKKAKATTISLAEKGVQGLKRVLEDKDTKEETNNDEQQ